MTTPISRQSQIPLTSSPPSTSPPSTNPPKQSDSISKEEEFFTRLFSRLFPQEVLCSFWKISFKIFCFICPISYQMKSLEFITIPSFFSDKTKKEIQEIIANKFLENSKFLPSHSDAKVPDALQGSDLYDKCKRVVNNS